MGKMDVNFKKQIKGNLENAYNIIVVTKNPLNSKIALKPIAGLDNMYEGTMTGEKILALEKSKQIISIERNGENFALDTDNT